ncbi:MAG: hypothetical protein CMC88_08515 [Flavobacteriaceae bacterium]|nr:hypothetical protein [Flavobacteriaceae bacterium]|tara:strand:+ start:39588 stop:40244 length:657 start_codon:yes stop_codon:yes gene_type:complete
MNKKIKKALVKIANEIIDLDNKKSINEEDVFHKVGQLNEVLSVYRFLKKNNITNWEIQENQLNLILNEIIGISESEEDLINQNSKLEVEPLIEKIKDIVTEMPEKIEEKNPLLNVSEDPIFVEKYKNKDSAKELKENVNDKFMKGLHIDLNDRLAFTKYLFLDNKSEYQRVISQIATFSNFEEVENFILTMIKPEYDNWEGKEDYEKRFLEVLSKLFQ